jgi:hypothetical protein
MSGKAWVDLDCRPGHLGHHMFQGNLYESLKAQGRW